MDIKIENLYSSKLPRHTEVHIKKIFDSLPKEHLRGIDHLRLVDTVADPRLRTQQPSKLPALYHPRQGAQPAWFEISMDMILPRSKSFFKNVVPRLAYKSNLAALIFSLVGQHYYLTQRHSVKKSQLEALIRAYTEKHMRRWSESQHTIRTRIFKPFRPTLERWTRSLQRRSTLNQ